MRRHDRIPATIRRLLRYIDVAELKTAGRPDGNRIHALVLISYSNQAVRASTVGYERSCRLCGTTTWPSCRRSVLRLRFGTIRRQRTTRGGVARSLTRWTVSASPFRMQSQLDAGIGSRRRRGEAKSSRRDVTLSARPRWCETVYTHCLKWLLSWLRVRGTCARDNLKRHAMLDVDDRPHHHCVPKADGTYCCAWRCRRRRLVLLLPVDINIRIAVLRTHGLSGCLAAISTCPNRTISGITRVCVVMEHRQRTDVVRLPSRNLFYTCRAAASPSERRQIIVKIDRLTRHAVEHPDRSSTTNTRPIAYSGRTIDSCLLA